MRVLVCIKRVPAPGARINVTEDGRSVDVTNLGFTTSPHEECALEEAVRIVERARASGVSDDDAHVTVLTLGPAQATEQLRYAASVGSHRFLLLDTSEAGENAWGPRATAIAIAEAVAEMEAADGAFDVILFGNESADSGGFQVGIRVARSLGRPMVNGIKAIEVGDMGSGDTVMTARREVDGGFEVYEVPTPAVFGVKEGINLPRYPTMKGRLKSKKAVIDERSVDAGDATDAVRVALRRPIEQASETVVLGSGSSDEDIAAAASAIVDLLAELELSP